MAKGVAKQLQSFMVEAEVDYRFRRWRGAFALIWGYRRSSLPRHSTYSIILNLDLSLKPHQGVFDDCRFLGSLGQAYNWSARAVIRNVCATVAPRRRGGSEIPPGYRYRPRKQLVRST